ncbi:MAG: hypothetical protein WCG92_01405 [Hyphomicrobiales bacterium]
MMSLKQFLVRMFGAAAIFVALCIAPSMANAHAGHGAHASPAVSTSASLVDIDVRADIEATDVQAHVIATSELRSGSAAPRPGCGGVLCCGNAPCAACAFVIVGDTAIVLPPRAGATPFWAAIVPGRGIGPQDLSRPPRSFV